MSLLQSILELRAKSHGLVSNNSKRVHVPLSASLKHFEYSVFLLLIKRNLVSTIIYLSCSLAAKIMRAFSDYNYLLSFLLVSVPYFDFSSSQLSLKLKPSFREYIITLCLLCTHFLTNTVYYATYSLF